MGMSEQLRVDGRKNKDEVGLTGSWDSENWFTIQGGDAKQIRDDMTGMPLNIELVNHHLDFTRGGHKCPLTKLVIGIFARVTEIIVLMDACYLCC